MRARSIKETFSTGAIAAPSMTPLGQDEDETEVPGSPEGLPRDGEADGRKNRLGKRRSPRVMLLSDQDPFQEGLDKAIANYERSFSEEQEFDPVAALNAVLSPGTKSGIGDRAKAIRDRQEQQRSEIEVPEFTDGGLGDEPELEADADSED